MNIVTIEDPIEMVFEDFNQVAVRPQIDITFASALRTVLRQDPDIIMVGEIRDSETADHAVQAALTGHLVLSTLHTNDAPSSVTRLLDLGVPHFLITTTLIGVLAQRLVREICTHCTEEYEPTPDEAALLRMNPEKLKEYKFRRGRGCLHCRQTGYSGRTGIFEVLPMTDKVRALVTSAGGVPGDLQGRRARRACARSARRRSRRSSAASPPRPRWSGSPGSSRPPIRAPVGLGMP